MSLLGHQRTSLPGSAGLQHMDASTASQEVSHIFIVIWRF
jgi:hypothetical protein